MNLYCNPLNIEYKFSHYGKVATREAADPTIIYFKGKYYIFASMSAGFYHSEDLTHWEWHENRKLDLYRYAPDVRQIGDHMYFCASSRKRSSIWRTKDPLSDQFERVSEPFAFWDPALFYDEETGKSYLYEGCGNDPLYVHEMDTKTMLPIGDKVQVMDSAPKKHGFERRECEGIHKPEQVGFLMKHVEPLVNPKHKPYIEGAFMNRFNGRYYFQYAAPGTEINTYADGVYVSDKGPMEGFEYQTHNPYSFVPSGFITGAGHGSTIADKYGNLWHMATMRISVNQSFERRIGLFPAGVDKDGILFCNQNFAAYPIDIPEGRFDPMSVKPAGMLLSYKKKGMASSSLEGHGPELALNEDIREWWCAAKSAGEWYQLDLGKEYPVSSIQLNLAEEGIPSLHKKYPRKERAGDISTNYRYVDSSRDHLVTRYVMEGSLDGKEWFLLKDASKADTDLSHDFLIFPEKIRVRYVKITAIKLSYDSKFAISGLRVFGYDSGKKPVQTSGIHAKRIGTMDARITWKEQKDAIGYNVRYGIAPDKLYNSYLIYGKNSVLITTLNEEADEYYAAVDSFNESGITEGEIHKLEA